MAHDAAQAPPVFLEALASLGRARTRGDVTLVETAAPGRIAPYAAAIDGEVISDEGSASGRFVLLHDPDGQEAWEGDFRIVTVVRAQVDVEVGGDDLWSDVAWSWLTDSLEDTPARAVAGTVTKTHSRSFGALAERPEEVQVEMRVSWTPHDNDLEPHIVAWANLLAMSAGLPPVPHGVSMLPGAAQ
ncbi:DUF3000 domain-containing protein [Demequina sp.]|uniref:DUF3000 domain-containing protein n=1 Tax=Demequina sp. TaxID=2050685 RepID=UPI003A8975D1